MFHDLARLLPDGVSPQLGPPEKPPDTFDEGYVLPAHSTKPLQTLHVHPLDARLRFYEEPHVYTFDGVPTSASVTAIAHEFEKPFVASEAIELMKTSRSQAWPRLQYVVDARPLAEEESREPTWSSDRGALLVVHGKTVAVAHPGSLSEDTTTDGLLSFLRTSAIKGLDEAGGEAEEVYTFERASTDEEIEEGWSRNGRLASHKGTEGHHLAELFFNGLPFRWWEPEMKVVFDFGREHMQDMVSWNTEKEIVCADADLAGSIDLIVWDAARRVHHIVDFKRSDKLAAQMRGFSKMVGVFAHLDDCKGAAYALQCSLYQYILERDYGLTIGDRILLSIHPEKPFATSVPYLREEVRFLMERRFALVRARRAAHSRDPARFRCDLTGAPLVDAVRAEDGRKMMLKAAQVHECEATPETPETPFAYVADHDTRRAFEEAVEVELAKLPEVALDVASCKSWKRLMPTGGIRPFSTLT